MERNQNQPIKRYMPGIDGLRAISVLAVIAYHFDLKWAQGGFLGVGIFFVLSGYLITDQILMEWQRNNCISLSDFWIRRFRRLLPAMILMLILVALWLVFTDPSRLNSLKGDFISSLFYVNNWYLIFHEVSYFESFGPPSPIGHLWSLSIEEQFYVIWPVILLIILSFRPLHRKRFIFYMLFLAAVSVFLMAVVYVPGTDPSRVYYGTDTRAFSILIGSALAVGWPSWKLKRKAGLSARKLLDTSGWIGIIVLIVLIICVNEYDDFLYPYGFLFLSLVSAVTIAVLVHPASHLGIIMGNRLLTWIGKRSYSLYIWHYPVIVLMKPADHSELSYIQIGVQLAIIFILSIVSYRYIEEPIRRGYFIEQLRQMRSHRLFKPILGAIVSVLVILIMISSITKLDKDQADADSIQSVNQNHTVQTADSVQKEDADIAESEGDSISNDSDLSKSPMDGEGITVIGDSVIEGVAPFLEDMLPGVVVDGKIGRQMSQAQEVVNEMITKGELGDQVILELGTNGPFTKNSLRTLISSMPDTTQVYLVTTRVPKNWQDTVNRTLKNVASEYQNVTIIDWYSASANRSELFYNDGVHLKPEGAKYYASFLVEQLRGN